MNEKLGVILSVNSLLAVSSVNSNTGPLSNQPLTVTLGTLTHNLKTDSTGSITDAIDTSGLLPGDFDVQVKSTTFGTTISFPVTLEGTTYTITLNPITYVSSEAAVLTGTVITNDSSAISQLSITLSPYGKNTPLQTFVSATGTINYTIPSSWLANITTDIFVVGITKDLGPVSDSWYLNVTTPYSSVVTIVQLDTVYQVASSSEDSSNISLIVNDPSGVAGTRLDGTGSIIVQPTFFNDVPDDEYNTIREYYLTAMEFTITGPSGADFPSGVTATASYVITIAENEATYKATGSASLVNNKLDLLTSGVNCYGSYNAYPIEITYQVGTINSIPQLYEVTIVLTLSYNGNTYHSTLTNQGMVFPSNTPGKLWIDYVDSITPEMTQENAVITTFGILRTADSATFNIVAWNKNEADLVNNISLTAHPRQAGFINPTLISTIPVANNVGTLTIGSNYDALDIRALAITRTSDVPSSHTNNWQLQNPDVVGAIYMTYLPILTLEAGYIQVKDWDGNLMVCFCGFGNPPTIYAPILNWSIAVQGKMDMNGDRHVIIQVLPTFAATYNIQAINITSTGLDVGTTATETVITLNGSTKTPTPTPPLTLNGTGELAVAQTYSPVEPMANIFNAYDLEIDITATTVTAAADLVKISVDIITDTGGTMSAKFVI